ncbi:MAG TPA: hypothetical protein VF493_04235 [Terriglobales bacterium]
MIQIAVSELRKTIDRQGGRAADELATKCHGQEVRLVIDEQISGELVDSLSLWLKEAGAIAIGLKY